MTSRAPSLVLSLACFTAVIVGSRYWERAQQQDLHITDAVNMSQLNAEERRHYTEYRQHEVPPGAAVQWVREERELADLKRSIDRQQDTHETFLRPSSRPAYGDTIPLRHTVSYRSPTSVIPPTSTPGP